MGDQEGRVKVFYQAAEDHIKGLVACRRSSRVSPRPMRAPVLTTRDDDPIGMAHRHADSRAFPSESLHDVVVQELRSPKTVTIIISQCRSSSAHGDKTRSLLQEAFQVFPFAPESGPVTLPKGLVCPRKCLSGTRDFWLRRPTGLLRCRHSLAEQDPQGICDA